MRPQISIPPALRARPFLLSEAVAFGLTERMLAGRRFRRLRHGVYAEASVPDTLATRADAALLVLPSSAVLSHQTAAGLRGLPVPHSPSIHATISPEATSTRAVGICSHRRDVRSTRVGGRPVTQPADNFVELAEHLGLVDLIVVGDAMVRRGLVTCADLVHATTRSARRRGHRVAGRAARLVRVKVDSPQETRTRLLLVLAGLPEPEPGFTVRDEDGGWLGEVDLAYPEFKIAIEYHGDVHRQKRGQWRSDIAKAEMLRRHGWTVIILTASDLDDRPERTLDRVLAELASARCSRLPATYRSEWRKYLAPQWARDLEQHHWNAS